jgi:HEAT repeat protein
MSKLTICALLIGGPLIVGCGLGRSKSLEGLSVKELEEIVQSEPEAGDVASFHNMRRRAAVEQLGRLGKPAEPALLNALQDREELVRFVAAESLSRNAPLSKEAIPALIKALPTDDFILIYEALDTTIDSLDADDAQECVPLLADVITDEQNKYDVRQFAGVILLKIDEEAALNAGVKARSIKFGDTKLGDALPDIVSQPGNAVESP